MKPIQFEGYENYSISEDGVVVNTSTGKVLKPDLNSTGYKRVTLWNSVRGRRREFVHRLVAIHYLPNKEGLPLVNHKDGIKLNTHYTNLEWVSCKDNTLHAFDKGLRVGPNRLDKDTQECIKELRGLGYSRGKVAELLGLKESRVSDFLYRYYKR